MGIDMNLLKQLRAMTFAPLKDCKEALVEADGDLDKAHAILKEKWILKAGKKTDRETNEGIVRWIKKDWKIIGIKLLCETDFVAKNDSFSALVDDVLEKIASWNAEFASKDEAPTELIGQVDVMLKEAFSSVWENMQLAEAFVTSSNGYIYNHPGNNVLAVVYFDGTDSNIAKEIALQVAAMNPVYLDMESVPADVKTELETKFRQELLESGKPENMVEQILKWKLSKALAEDVLLEQEYIRDWSKKIKNIIPEWFTVTSFKRMAIK